jgi:hypothetical protein
MMLYGATIVQAEKINQRPINQLVEDKITNQLVEDKTTTNNLEENLTILNQQLTPHIHNNNNKLALTHVQVV